MILLKRFQNPIFLNNFFSAIIVGTTSFTKTYNNPLTQIPIQKLLALSSNKKCDSLDDAKLYAYIFEAFSKSGNLNNKLQASMDKQAERMVVNFLGYMPKLSVNQIFFVANHILESFYSKKIKFNEDLTDNFIRQVNHHIFLSLKEERNEPHQQNIIAYIKKILLMKKSTTHHIKQILQFLIINAKKQSEIIQILELFALMKYRSPMPIQLLLRELLENKIGPNIEHVPLKSPLVDQIVLRIFIQFRAHFKKPYNCFPPWMITLLQKITQKYMDPNYNINSFKKIAFLKCYCKLMTQILPISEVSLFLPRHFQNLVTLFHHISQQVLDYADNQNPYQKALSYLSTVKLYKQFLRKVPCYQTMNNLILFEEIYQKILNQFLAGKDLYQMEEEEQQNFCELISIFSYQLVRLSKEGGGRVSKRLLLNAYENQSQIFIQLSKKYEKNYNKYFLLFPMLSPIALLHQQLNSKYTNILLSNSKINHNRIQVIQRINKILSQTDNRVLLEYYKISRNEKISEIQFVDFVGACYLFTLFMDQPISSKLEELYQWIKFNNLTAIIDNMPNSPLLQKQKVIKQLIKVSEILMHNISEYFSSASLGDQQQEYTKDRSSTKYKFKNLEDKICNNSLSIFKSGPDSQIGLISPMYEYWFIQNATKVGQMFLGERRSFVSMAWYNLKTLIRYLNNSVYYSAIDLSAEIMRVSINNCKDQNQRSYVCQKLNQLFLDRNAQVVLRSKVDDFANQKYNYLISLFIDYNTQSPRIQKHVKNNLKKKEKAGFDQEDQNKVLKTDGQNESNQSFSLILQLELTQFCSTQLNKPLQTNNQRSKLICQSMNRFLQKIYKCAQENVKSNPKESTWQKKKQNLIANSPIQQIIYQLCLHNYLSPVPTKHNPNNQNSEWFKAICLSTLIQNLKTKYSRVSIYNLLLAFDMKETKNKKVHDEFLSEQLEQEREKNMRAQRDSQSIQLQPTSYKFYYYLLSPNQTNQVVERHVSELRDDAKMKDSEVVDYWVNKNIVLRTVDERLIDVMLVRLFECKEITYLQYCTALNTIITLIDLKKLMPYEHSEMKNRKLRQWVHSQLDWFAAQRADQLLPAYLTLRRYFGKNQLMQSQLTQLINAHLQDNSIYLLENLFDQKHQLANSSIEEMKGLLTRGRQRCILKDYYGTLQSCQFRVQVVLMRIYGLILLQHNADLLKWFNQSILAHVDPTNIQAYLTNPNNKAQLNGTIMRHKISQNILNRTFNSPLHSLLHKLISQHEQQTQTHISVQQQLLSQNTRMGQQSNASFVRVGQSSISLMKQNNMKQYTYFTNNQQLIAEQLIQKEYIKVFDKDILFQVRAIE